MKDNLRIIERRTVELKTITTEIYEREEENYCCCDQVRKVTAWEETEMNVFERSTDLVHSHMLTIRDESVMLAGDLAVAWMRMDRTREMRSRTL